MAIVLHVDFEKARYQGEQRELFSRLAELTMDRKDMEMPNAYRSQLIRAFVRGSESRTARVLVDIYDNPRPVIDKMRCEGKEYHEGFTPLLKAVFLAPEKFL